jgi:hypothetical protein
VQVTAEVERQLQSRSAGSYYGSLLGSYCAAVGSSLLLQEGIKVLLITVVSPQLLPRVTALRRTPLREAMRLVIRGLVGLVYFGLRAL